MTLFTIPPFYFPNGRPLTKEQKEWMLTTIVKVKEIYENQPYLSETQFLSVTKACGLPRFMNLLFFRKLQSFSKDSHVPFSVFVEGWTSVALKRPTKAIDNISLYFNLIKKTPSQWISPEDFLPILEDIVIHHPGLQFLTDNPMFQERYIETVICTIFYQAKCKQGKMLLSHFRKSNFVHQISQLEPNTDLNNTKDCFSYKQFYVLYVKFWELDTDHDLIISATDLTNYNGGLFSSKLITQIMQYGRIPAFATREDQSDQLTLNYLDYIWLLMSEIDKSTPSAIEYWFHCMDEDGDGIIRAFDLVEYWHEQDKKLRVMFEGQSEDNILFENLICQMNDLIQPEILSQFTMTDLKKNTLAAERFFDTFCNIQKFLLHDNYQGLIRANQQLVKESKRQHELEKKRLIELKKLQIMIGDGFGWVDRELDLYQHLMYEPFSLGLWSDYVEQEYEILLVREHYDEEEEDEEEVVSDEDTPQDEKMETTFLTNKKLLKVLLTLDGNEQMLSSDNQDKSSSIIQTVNENHWLRD
ncbi:hypothetical protein BD560DRAFT_386898 [Blakeslea trispora]|nr:hypothetical protein BD560DRAFT_386898 [Blakeslea trispora]